VTYSNSRFGSLRDNESTATSSSFQKPVATKSSRFGSLNTSPSMKKEQEAFPGLKSTKNQSAPKRQEKTVEELNKELKELRLKDQREAKAAGKEPPALGGGSQRRRRRKKKEKEKELKAQGPTEEELAQREAERIKAQEEAKRKERQRLLRKFKKALKEKKALEVGPDTMKMLEIGLSVKGNILKQSEENYEKIARMVAGVLMNKSNVKGEGITLADVYRVIFEQKVLRSAETEFVALVLEILSQIEEQQSPLAVVSAVEGSEPDVLREYLSEIPSVRTEKIQNEFVEYGLQFVFPLDDDAVLRVQQHLDSKPSVEAMLEFVSAQSAKTKIHSNYRTMGLMLSYSLNAFYFAECTDRDTDQCYDLAKELIYAPDRSGDRKPMTRLIRMLCYAEDEGKGDDEEEEEEEEDDDDEVSSHSLLALSMILTASSRRQNEHHGLVPLLRAIDDEGLIPYAAVEAFVQIQEDRFTEERLAALSKMTDWIAELDHRAMKLRELAAQEAVSEDEDYDDGYVGNVFKPRVHKTAADYEQPFSLITE